MKNLANSLTSVPNKQGYDKVNDDKKMLELITDIGGGSYRRLNALAKNLGVYIRVFLYDNKNNKIGLSKVVKKKD